MYLLEYVQEMRIILKYSALQCLLWHLWQQKGKNSCDACVRVRAKGSDYRYFYTSKNSVFDGWFVDCFLPPNIHWKQAVVFHKTTRCFHQNDTLFFIKRYVVFIKTSRRLKCNNALCWLSRLTLRCCKWSNDRLGIILPQKKVGTKRKWLCRSEFATQSLGW